MFRKTNHTITKYPQKLLNFINTQLQFSIKLSLVTKKKLNL